MGSSTLIDIIGSLLIGGILLLVAVNMNEKATKNTYDSQASLTVQQNLTSLINNVEFDFRKIGYCRNPALTPDPTNYIVYGSKDTIEFVSDLSNDGTLDTVTWGLGDFIPGPNKAIRMLWRKVDSLNYSAVYGSNLGVTDFSLEYLDAFNQAIPLPYHAGDPATPQFIRLYLKLEPTAAYDTAYSTNFAIWTQTRLVSKNLQNR